MDETQAAELAAAGDGVGHSHKLLLKLLATKLISLLARMLCKIDQYLSQ